MWSMARRLATAMSQAPGLSGTPDSGHCSSAATSASWASSSARPTSRTIRVRAAISLADSIRKTASIARCGSRTATGATLGPLFDLLAEPLLLLAQLGRELVAEVVGLEDRPQLEHALLAGGVRAALRPLDGLVHVADFPEPVA